MSENHPTVKQEEVSAPQPDLPPSDSLTTKSTKSPKKHRLRPQIIIALVILVIISGIIGVSIYQNQANQQAATAQHNAYLSTLTGNGTLVFTDPLKQENGSQWTASSDDVGICQFADGAYNVKQQSSAPKACNTRDDTYSNFAFEVQLTITQGGCGGIAFRDDVPPPDYGAFYQFRICQNGRYDIAGYASYGAVMQLPYGTSPAIHLGLGQPNTIGVRANGSSMTFYVNEQFLAQAQDSTYTSGHIGLIAYPYNGVASVSYSNARFWTL